MTRREALRQTQQAETLRALGFTANEAESLRRISMTLRRWYEHECNGTIQREGEDGTGRPRWYNTYTGRMGGYVPDRELGALRRLKAIIDRRNDNLACGLLSEFGGRVAYYIQGDPRGAALYILRPGDVPEGGDPSAYYSRGVCVY